MAINPSIFKAYDIRGIYPNDLNEETAAAIGFALTKMLKAEKIIVGRDMRLSGEKIFNALTQGITNAGAEVINIGLVPTDAAYFASGVFNLPAVMITASHNPAEWIGFKITRSGAIPFGEDDIKKLKEKSVLKPLGNAPAAKEKITTYDIVPEYLNNALSFIDKNKIKPLKIAADAGNGMAGKFIPLLYNGLPCSLIPLYFELDGSFPNHPASPIEYKNLIDLQKKIKEEKADFGMAFDGDADRVFFIDENSAIINGSIIAAIIAEYFLEKHKGEKIIYDLRCSHVVPEIIVKNGGQAIISRVGHSFIKKTMRETGAIFGGEFSGHYYYRDNFCADSAMITALIITQIISEANMPLSSLVKNYLKYWQIEETNSSIDDKDAVIKNLKEKYKDGKITELDGMTVEYDDWWFNVRPSNTEPVLRLNLEAKTKELIENKNVELLKIIRS